MLHPPGLLLLNEQHALCVGYSFPGSLLAQLLLSLSLSSSVSPPQKRQSHLPVTTLLPPSIRSTALVCFLVCLFACLVFLTLNSQLQGSSALIPILSQPLE